MKPGQFIVIEGLEGAGKSTAITFCQDFLRQHDIPCVVTREPGGTRVAEKIRSIFKEFEQDEPLDAKTELLLLYASRVQHLEYFIKPALARGTWVICDRFELSTIAYQCGGRGIDFAFVQSLSQFCLNDFSPSLTIYMDIDPELGLLRAGQRGQADRIEKESLAFFKAVADRYHEQIAKLERSVVIDAALALEQVQSHLRFALQSYILQHEH